ncbi:helix-turn-helix domain-containing protein [Termitidicoccus mucosus]|uniref:helix-turn-helix domain-containing protein n=1 Tax=Termitidicoccus mucosus TaxID=1184151 RepID=UPI00268304A7
MAASKDTRTPAQIQLARQLGAVLRDVRNKAALNQEELAWRCEIHRAYMGFIEQGRYSITVAMLVQVCEQLGIKPSAVLRRIGL